MSPLDEPETHRASENLIGITAIFGSMAAFVANDTCVKLIGESVPLGELITLRNAIATLYLLMFAVIFGGMTLPANPPRKLMAWRVLADLLATLLFLSGLIALPIADATALSQFMPLAMTAAAAIFLKEHVGWRRWLAALVGLMGVLLIVRPGTTAFSPAALLILAAVGFMVVRDLATRRIGQAVPTLTLAAMSTAAGISAGLFFLPYETWVWPDTRAMLLLMLSGALLVIAYALIIIAMRHGDIAIVSPFRYAVIPPALLSGWMIWGEFPDNVQLLGIAVLTSAGIYTFHRERMRTLQR